MLDNPVIHSCHAMIISVDTNFISAVRNQLAIWDTTSKFYLDRIKEIAITDFAFNLSNDKIYSL